MPALSKHDTICSRNNLCLFTFNQCRKNANIFDLACSHKNL
ncbi:hypothetical protein GPLA_0015 [Paraglaciecola polaris LMG 21857]|uniref:Uncharacterized protein n=1 Tax=Paraglaciecola polaris LMG 21857 TaxID=1129793 RepID=K6Z3Z1_9ALTE|nr:hypothetical protein GPLA_0015 [Paraglaciecola polaris LMG 21857]